MVVVFCHSSYPLEAAEAPFLPEAHGIALLPPPKLMMEIKRESALFSKFNKPNRRRIKDDFQNL